MKYLLIMLMVLLCLTGCGGKTQPSAETTVQTQPPTEPFAFTVSLNNSLYTGGMAIAVVSESELAAEYAWYLDGTLLSGVSDHMLSIPLSAAGKELTVQVTAQGYTAQSQPVLIQAQELETYPMAAVALDSKLYGRCQLMGSGLVLNYSASGIEMNLRSEGGDLTVQYIAGYDMYVAVLVDGQQVDRPLLATGLGSLRVPLSPGEHRVMLLKETEVNTVGKSLQLQSMSFDGQLLERPADRDLYIEFIGDSIACGDGALGTYTAGKKWVLQDHSGTNGFAYLTARALDADWSVFAKGGIGLVAKIGDYNIGEMFNYVNRFGDDTPYKPARIPDVVVIELGANDDKQDTAGFVSAYGALLDQIRALYGQDVKIVWTGKNQNQYAAAQHVTEQRQDANLFCFQYTYGGSGSAAKETQSAGHPSAAEQQAFAHALAEYLKDHVL